MTERPSIPEVWLRGPIEGIQPLLQPAAHTLAQVGEDVLPIVEESRARAALGPAGQCRLDWISSGPACRVRSRAGY